MTGEEASRRQKRNTSSTRERLLAELSEQFISKETEFATTGAEFARFREPARGFAPLYRELDDLEAQIARLLALEEGTLRRTRRPSQRISGRRSPKKPRGSPRSPPRQVLQSNSTRG